MQVLPIVVHNLVDKRLTKLVCKACAVAMRIYTRRLPERYTEEDLREIDSAIIQLRNLLRELYDSSVNLDTPKFHKLSHITSDIRRLRHPKHYNSDLYEAAHVILKRLYRYEFAGTWSPCM
jgi:hypothetical protein